MLLIVIFCHDSEVMQNAGSVQALLARELAEYEMQVEQNVLAPMTSLLEVIKIMNILMNILYYLTMVSHCTVNSPTVATPHKRPLPVTTFSL